MKEPFEFLRTFCLLAAVYVGAPACRAQGEALSDADSEAIRSAGTDYMAALRRGDVESLRKRWTADGDYIDSTGRRLKAHELLETVVPAGESAAEAAEAAPKESTLRLIAPGVAIEDGATEYAVSVDGRALVGRFTAIWVKRDGSWLLDSVREATAASTPGHPQLKALDWLVGEWTGAADDASIIVSWQWAEGGNYLVGEFLMYGQGGGPVSGTQRIAWDPVAKQIKSWIFGSHGGSGEGTWRRDGEGWLVDSKHVTADGMKWNTTSKYSPGQDGSFVLEVASTWEASANRTGIDKLPAQRFTFRRAAANE
jgi:ketosteroid isomerase-like protein